MSSITITLCASTRTGCISAAIPACAEVSLTLAGDLTLPAGTSLALLTPRGTTLAHTILHEQAAPGASLPLSTITAQAAEYTHSCRAGDTREALLAIGDSEHPLALVPARIAQNPLYTLAPPTAQAPAYPTSEALHALLAEIQAAATDAANSATAAEAAQGNAEAAQRAAQSAATSASESAKGASASEQAALSAKQSAETAQGQAKASETAAKASETAAKGSETAASASEKAAKASEQAADESATAAAGSATAAKASATAAKASETAAAGSATAAKASATAAAGSATAAASSSSAAATSASQAATSAAEAASQVTDTLKRINFAGGRFYSQYYNGNALGITHNGWTGDACIMAWNDRYIIITTAPKQGWMTVNGLDFSFIASSPYHFSQYLYTAATFYCLGFNGARVAIFYRFDGGNKYAEVLDANTGEVLIEKTFTDEEMAIIKAAPCWDLAFTCVLKNGDMIHRGTIFSGEDLSIKGYVATEENFLIVRGIFSTYCCYLTANADNGYSGEDPIIVQSNDNFSFWVDDRYTLDDEGNPVVTLRNFQVDGIFDESNQYTRGVCVLFSKVSTVYGNNIYDSAIVRNGNNGTLAAYAVALDETRANRIVFTKKADISITNKIANFIPVNLIYDNINYTATTFYLKLGAFIYAVDYKGAVSSEPCITLVDKFKGAVRWSSPYYLAPVAYSKGILYKLIPTERFFYNGACLIYTTENA